MLPSLLARAAVQAALYLAGKGAKKTKNEIDDEVVDFLQNPIKYLWELRGKK